MLTMPIQRYPNGFKVVFTFDNPPYDFRPSSFDWHDETKKGYGIITRYHFMNNTYDVRITDPETHKGAVWNFRELAIRSAILTATATSPAQSAQPSAGANGPKFKVGETVQLPTHSGTQKYYGIILEIFPGPDYTFQYHVKVTNPPDWNQGYNCNGLLSGTDATKGWTFTEQKLCSTNPIPPSPARPYDASTGLCPQCGSPTTQPVRTIYCTKCEWKMEP